MRIKLFTLLLFFVFSINAQDFSGRAIYKTSRKSNFKIGGGKSTMSDKQKKEIEARLKKMNQRTFILEFDKTTSNYKEEVKLNSPKPNVGGIRVFSISSGGIGKTYYKNLKDKRFANKTEIMGKVFLIKDSLPKYKWELSSETKNIGNYTCYKATFSREVENVRMSIVDGDTKEVKKKETIVTTAWYTPQLPISNGPKNYQGLPGLILEINDGTTTIVCTEVVINPTKKISISEPKKGKVVTQEKFDKISREKTKEMMENFKSRNGRGMQIRIGG